MVSSKRTSSRNPEVTTLIARAGLPWSVTALGFVSPAAGPSQTNNYWKGGLVIDRWECGQQLQF